MKIFSSFFLVLMISLLVCLYPQLSITIPLLDTSNLDQLIMELEIDKEAQVLIQSGNDKFYKVYTRDRDVNNDVELRYWRGLLLVPDLSEKSGLTNFRSGEIDYDNWWYANKDGSFSKYIGNAQNDIIGLINIDNKGNYLVGYDLDSDRIFDVIYKKSPDDKELLISNETNGADFIESPNDFIDSLCGESLSPSSNLGNIVDIRAIFDICAVSGEGSGEQDGLGGIGITPGTTGSGLDILDTLCGEVSGGIGSNIGSGMTSDDSLTEQYADKFRDVINDGFDGQQDSLPTMIGRILVLGFAPGVEGAARAGFWAAVVLDLLNANGLMKEEGKKFRDFLESLTTDTNVDADNQDDSEAEGNTQGEDSNEEEPVDIGDDEETQPGCVAGDPNCENGNEALKELCDRLNGDDTFLDSIEDDIDQAAPDTNCDDPVVNPDPVEDSEDGEINCHPGRGQGMDTDNMEDLLNVGPPGNDCGPTETPGPDGECNGLGLSFLGSGVRGSLWLGYSEIVGIDFCNDFVCDDFQ